MINHLARPAVLLCTRIQTPTRSIATILYNIVPYAHIFPPSPVKERGLGERLGLGLTGFDRIPSKDHPTLQPLPLKGEGA